MQILKEKTLLIHAVALLKHIDAPAGIDELLLTREKRMAFGANFHVNILLRGSGLNHIPAGAGNCRLLILGMNVFLHCCHLFHDILRLNIWILSYRL